MAAHGVDRLQRSRVRHRHQLDARSARVRHPSVAVAFYSLCDRVFLADICSRETTAVTSSVMRDAARGVKA